MTALRVLLAVLLCLGRPSSADYSPEPQLGNDWSWLDHWGTVLHVRKEFSRQNSYQRSPLSLLRNTTHKHGERSGLRSQGKCPSTKSML